MTRRWETDLVFLVAGIVFVTAGSRCNPQAPDDPTDWPLLWQDEFDGPGGQSPDAKRWRFDVGTDWGNEQLEYDTARPENVSLDGAGHLLITAREEAWLGQPYTSGRINTRDLFEQRYGRFEARMRLPSGRGLWPAFWLLGANFAEVGWPDCGEIDIMEYRGQEPRVVQGSLHGPGYSGGGAVTGRLTLSEGRFDDRFHVFAVEWRADRVDWLVDGTRYQTIDRSDIPAGRPWVFDHPFFLILNVAVGGSYVGSPDASTTFPQTMLVDWVRVYGSEP